MRRILSLALALAPLTVSAQELDWRLLCPFALREGPLNATDLASIREILRHTKEAAGHEPCFGTKKFIERQDWPALRERIWGDERFRNDYPAGMCFQRATILSHELDRLGFRTEKIQITGPMLALHKTSAGFQARQYDIHQANHVMIREADGTLAGYVLDPMFTEDLMPVREYLERIEQRKGAGALKYRIMSQSHEPEKLNDYRVAKDYDPAADTCRYSLADLKGARGSLELLEMDKEAYRRLTLERTSFPTEARARRAYLYFFEAAPDPGTNFQDSETREDVLAVLEGIYKPMREDWKLKFLSTYPKEN